MGVQAVMERVLCCLLALIVASLTQAEDVSSKTVAEKTSSESSEQDEINTEAVRYLAIMETMFNKINRALFGDSAKIPAFATKIVTDVMTYLAWFLQQLATGDAFATPGPPPAG